MKKDRYGIGAKMDEQRAARFLRRLLHFIKDEDKFRLCCAHLFKGAMIITRWNPVKGANRKVVLTFGQGKNISAELPI